MALPHPLPLPACTRLCLPVSSQGLNVSPLAGDCVSSGLSSVPPKFMSTQNLRCDLTQRVLAHVRVELSPRGVRVGTGAGSVFVGDRRGHRQTPGRRSCEDRGSRGEGGATSRGRGGGHSPKTPGEARQDSSLLPSEGARASGPLDFRVLACRAAGEYTPVVLRASRWR